MIEEEWRPVPIPGYEDNYQVSNHGQVWSRPRPGARGGIKAQWPDSDGYPCVRLSKPSTKPLNRKVATLVALAFIGSRPYPEAEVCHFDDNKTNSVLTNLRYDSPSGNMQDLLRHGRHHQVNKDRCPQGHLYDEANTYQRPDRPGRNCRKCGAANARQKRALRHSQ